MKIRAALRTVLALAAVAAVFAPSAASACSTETYDYEVVRTASIVEPDASIRLAPGTSTTYNYTELVNQSASRTNVEPSGADVVPGSVAVDRYYWQSAAYDWVDRGQWVNVPVYGWVDRGSYVWSSNMQWEVVGYQRVSQGYWEGYYEAVPYSYDAGHTAWSVHRCWFHRHPSTAGFGQHNHNANEGHCPLGHDGGYGWFAHENRQAFWHSIIVSGVTYELRQRWIDTSYDQAVYGWVDRGSWVWSSNMQWEVVGYQPTWQPNMQWEVVRWDDTSGTTAPPASGNVRNLTFDARWQIYVARQGMTDPRPVGIPFAPGSLTFNYTEILTACTDPT